MNDNEFFDTFYRPFSFRSMFEDDPLRGLDQFSMNHHNFATNYNQNFRSFGLNDLIQQAM